MLKQKVKVLAQAQVIGPGGIKLQVGKVYDLEDSSYVRILVKSGTVSLIDPPSLDPDFLERGGYQLREGFSHPPKSVIEKLVKKESEKEIEKEAETVSEPKAPEAFLTKFPKKEVRVSEELVSDEKGNPKEGEPKSTDL